MIRTLNMVYNSSAFGLPQSRRRLYIVGYTDEKCAGKIFPVDCGAEKAPKELIVGMQGQRVYDVSGSAITQCASAGGWGGKTGLYFIDLNPNPQLTGKARLRTAKINRNIRQSRADKRIRRNIVRANNR